VRLGRCSEATRRLLQGCLRRTLPDEDGVGAATRLCSHVKDCEKINAACLAELPGEVRTFRARDTGRDEASLAQLRCSAAAPAELKLKAGAQVILTKTLDAASGLVNGARGRVLRFLATQNPVVRFGGVEHVLRMEQFSLSQGGQTIASRTQLPLAHGWGARRHFEPRMAGARPGFRPPPPPTPLTLPPSHPLHVARPSAHAPVYPLRCPTRHSAEHP
jgi:hypothetical protein